MLVNMGFVVPLRNSVTIFIDSETRSYCEVYTCIYSLLILFSYIYSMEVPCDMHTKQSITLLALKDKGLSIYNSSIGGSALRENTFSGLSSLLPFLAVFTPVLPLGLCSLLGVDSERISSHRSCHEAAHSIYKRSVCPGALSLGIASIPWS